MSFQGMNVEQAQSTAGKVVQLGQQIEQDKGRILQQLQQMQWVGPDHDAFVNEVNDFVSTALNGFMEALKQQAQLLIKQAEQQSDVSLSH